MPNLNISELMRVLIRIRDSIDKVEVKGQENRSCLYHAYEDCNALLRQLGKLLDEVQKLQDEQAQKPELKEVKLDDPDQNS